MKKPTISRSIRTVMALGMLATASAAQGSRWKEGERLPDLRLPTIDGARTIDLAELRGTKLLLVEFASW